MVRKFKLASKRVSSILSCSIISCDGIHRKPDLFPLLISIVWAYFFQIQVTLFPAFHAPVLDI
jgi:hypothetical protein